MNYYDVLGIPRDCEQSLIEHIYKALVRIYHPDVFKGDRSFAEEKLKTINEAYFDLGNADRRKAYDAELSRGQSAGSADEMYDDEWTEHDAFSEYLAQDWRVATDYFRNIDSLRQKLVQINKTLAFFFQTELIATKRFRDAEEIFSRIRGEYLDSKFGDDKDVHELVLSAIETGHRRFALDLNKALVVVGKNEFLTVIDRLIDKYPDFCNDYYTSSKFSFLIRRKNSLGMEPGRYRVGQKRFSVTTDYFAYFENACQEQYDSVKSLIASDKVSETEVRAAYRIF